MAVLSRLPDPLATIGITAIFFFLAGRQLLIHISLRRSQEAFKAKYGCKPILARYPTKLPLSLDFIRENVKAARAKVFLATLCRRFERVGTTFDVTVLSRYAVFTIAPENIKTILSLRFNDYSLGQRPVVMGRLLGKGIFTTDGEEWSHSRAMLRPNFQKDQVADLATFETHIQDLLKLIPKDGSVVDLQDLFFRFTLDSATDFLFGHSVHSLRDSAENDRKFGEAFNYSLGELAMQFRLGPLRKLRRNPKAIKAYDYCRAYVDQFVNKAVEYRQKVLTTDLELEKGSEKHLFLHELAKATDNKDRIRDELLNILIAGRDTTASLISHLFFQLARNPESWRKLREEIAKLEGRPPTYEELRDFKYSKFCIQETLRLFPPVPTNTRLAIRDTVLPEGGGPDGTKPIFVPKGGIVIYTVYAMHRRKDFFGEDAEEFRPERWADARHSWGYLPFNGGPRMCLGQQYALTEATYVLVRMLQEFKQIDSADPLPWTEGLTLTVASANGVKVRLHAVDG